MSLTVSPGQSARMSREQWLQERRRGIGASDVGAVFGVSPWCSPLKLYFDKLGLLDQEPETFSQKVGKLMEPVVLQLYKDHLLENGEGGEVVQFAEQQFMRSAEFPHLSATLDAVGDDGRIVELKWSAGDFQRQWGEEGTDECPDAYALQAIAQMVVAGVDQVDIAALIGGRFGVWRVRRDDELCGLVVRKTAEFWARVTSRTPPEATGRDLEVLARLRPSEGTRAELASPLLPGVASEYEEAGRRIRQLEEDRKALKARLIEAMGDAAVGVLADGREVVRKMSNRKGYTVEPREYVDFRIRSPR